MNKTIFNSILFSILFALSASAQGYFFSYAKLIHPITQHTVHIFYDVHRDAIYTDPKTNKKTAHFVKQREDFVAAARQCEALALIEDPVSEMNCETCNFQYTTEKNFISHEIDRIQKNRLHCLPTPLHKLIPYCKNNNILCLNVDHRVFTDDFSNKFMNKFMDDNLFHTICKEATENPKRIVFVAVGGDHAAILARKLGSFGYRVEKTICNPKFDNFVLSNQDITFNHWPLLRDYQIDIQNIFAPEKKDPENIQHDLTRTILEARAQAGKQIVQRSAIAATGIIGLAAAGYKYITSWL